MRALWGIVVSLALVFSVVGCGASDADRGVNLAGGNTSRAGEATRTRHADGRPNIVFVMTDDMDERMLARMPTVGSRMMDAGVTFDNAFVTQSLCCPSRATALRGQYSHNHSITTNDLPEGGAAMFRRRGLDESTFATWLQDSGYRTGLVGKYLNNEEEDYVPPGWDEWYGMTGTASDHALNQNGNVRHYPRTALMTDVYPPFRLDLGRSAPEPNTVTPDATTRSQGAQLVGSPA